VVQPEITIAEGARDVSISKTGQVQVVIGDEPQPQEAGQIQMATFINEAGLEAIGDNLLLESGSSGAAVIGSPGDTGFGTLMQGYTEASNVDAVSEITALIVAQRAYEMNSKVINTADEMLSAANQLKQ
jgi:flagellar basal-body rod protein FlgG